MAFEEDEVELGDVELAVLDAALCEGMEEELGFYDHPRPAAWLEQRRRRAAERALVPPTPTEPNFG